MRRFSSLLLGLSVATLIAVFLLGCAGASSPAAAPATMGPVGRSVAGGDAAGGPVDDDGTSAQAPIPSGAGALIIHTGSIELEVADMRPAIDQATVLIAGLGGHVAESHEQNAGEYQAATVTYRIPAARWAEAVAGLRALGQKVLSEDTDAQDVTAQVVDLDARIANLRASELALQGIMARATTITDVLKVQAELTGVRGDIESMTAQRDRLADQAALGTLEVRFNVPVDEAAVATRGWDLGREVDSALATLVRVGQGTTSLAVWLLIVGLPVFIPILVAIFAGVRIRRWYVDRQQTRTPVLPPM